MNKHTKSFDLSFTCSDRVLRDEQIILGAAFICRNDSNPTEIISMLGITDDLQELRRSRRLRKYGTTQEL